MQTLRIWLGTAVAAVVVAGCSVPFMNNGDSKSECDQIAARAIQTNSAREARDLAAQATECYARLAGT